ncbi:MAG: Hint domain-containing protein [Pseudomonadota bacterium]
MFGWKKAPAPRRMSEISGALDGGFYHARGLMAGTRVGTSMGWRRVEALQAGDLVLTFDNGLQPLVELRREIFWVTPETGLETVLIPAGAMGNAVDVELLPDQGVLIESDAACDAHGDPFAVVRAKVLAGFRGTRCIDAPRQMEVITLVFAAEEVIYAEAGVLVHCPRAIVRLDDLGVALPAYDVLDDQAGAFLVDYMTLDPQGGPLAPHPAAA